VSRTLAAAPDAQAKIGRMPMFRVFTEKTPLYKIVAEHLEGWLETRAVAEQPVSAHIERELRSYLTCGILCFGSALNHHVHLHIFRVSSTCCDTVPGRPSRWSGSP
jgi:hypothetical protein